MTDNKFNLVQCTEIITNYEGYIAHPNNSIRKIYIKVEIRNLLDSKDNYVEDEVYAYVYLRLPVASKKGLLLGVDAGLGIDAIKLLFAAHSDEYHSRSGFWYYTGFSKKFDSLVSMQDIRNIIVNDFMNKII